MKPVVHIQEQSIQRQQAQQRQDNFMKTHVLLNRITGDFNQQSWQFEGEHFSLQLMPKTNLSDTSFYTTVEDNRNKLQGYSKVTVRGEQVGIAIMMLFKSYQANLSPSNLMTVQADLVRIEEVDVNQFINKLKGYVYQQTPQFKLYTMQQSLSQLRSFIKMFDNVALINTLNRLEESNQLLELAIQDLNNGSSQTAGKYKKLITTITSSIISSDEIDKLNKNLDEISERYRSLVENLDTIVRTLSDCV